MSCVFCAIVGGAADASVVLDEGDLMAFMDIHPFRPGHVLLIPKGHAQRVSELDEELRARLFEAGVRVGAAIRRSGIGCDDLHLLINDGPAANQTVPHVHLHVLPRRRGDLARTLGNLLKRPVVGLLRPAPRTRLDEHARVIAACL